MTKKFCPNQILWNTTWPMWPRSFAKEGTKSKPHTPLLCKGRRTRIRSQTYIWYWMVWFQYMRQCVHGNRIYFTSRDTVHSPTKWRKQKSSNAGGLKLPRCHKIGLHQLVLLRSDGNRGHDPGGDEVVLMEEVDRAVVHHPMLRKISFITLIVDKMGKLVKLAET